MILAVPQTNRLWITVSDSSFNVASDDPRNDIILSKSSMLTSLSIVLVLHAIRLEMIQRQSFFIFWYWLSNSDTTGLKSHNAYFNEPFVHEIVHKIVGSCGEVSENSRTARDELGVIGLEEPD